MLLLLLLLLLRQALAHVRSQADRGQVQERRVGAHGDIENLHAARQCGWGGRRCGCVLQLRQRNGPPLLLLDSKRSGRTGRRRIGWSAGWSMGRKRKIALLLLTLLLLSGQRLHYSRRRQFTGSWGPVLRNWLLVSRGHTLLLMLLLLLLLLLLHGLQGTMI